MKLIDLWEKSGKKSGLKVRWQDWSVRHRFFVIEKLNEKESSFLGKLDCGESIAYSSESNHWSLYTDGDEDGAKAS